MATKKRKSSSPLNWHDCGRALLTKYLEKVSGGRGRVFVLNHFGDLVLDAGKGDVLDWTSIGSIATSVQSAALGFDRLLKRSGSSGLIQFGEKTGFWLADAHSKWMLLGLNTPFKRDQLKDFYSHLKSAHSSGSNERSSREALDGMTETGIESAFSRKFEGEQD